MNWLNKGPDVKLPSFGGGGLKAPAFLVNLYWDLRDRRLLPLVALVIVAIAAVPFLLGGGSEDEPAAPADIGAALGRVTTGSAELAVVESKPGLRDYRKRLHERRPTDPFEQRYTAPVLDGSELGPKGEGSSGGSGTTPTTTKTTTGETTKTSDTKTSDTKTSDTGSSGGGEPGVTLYSFAVDVKIVRTETKPGGGKEKEKSTRSRVLPATALPGEKQPLVTYMGISPKSHKPLLLISDEVGAVYGEGHCLSGSEACQLLEVETGLPVTFVHAGSGVRYKLTLLDVRPVSAGKAGSRAG